MFNLRENIGITLALTYLTNLLFFNLFKCLLKKNLISLNISF